MSKVKDRNPGKVVGHQERQLFGDAATKAYVDHHISIIQQGALKHSVTAILSSPPANPSGMYIVGKNPTGAWSAFAGMVVLHVPGFGGRSDSWAEMTPGDKEERLVDADKKVYQYNAATKEWNAVAIGSSTPNPYPKILHYWQHDGDATGTLNSVTIPMVNGNIYQVTGYVGATYNNDSDRFQVGIFRNNTEMAHVQSATIGSVYKSSCNLVYHQKHTEADMGITWDLRLLWYAGGVILDHSQFVITDLGPQP